VDIDKVEVIHRGVDTDQYHPNYTPSSEWKEKWHTDYRQLEGKLVLTLPARITAWKGQHDFIRCIEKLVNRNVNVHGLIVGETHPRKQDFLAELEQGIAELNLENHITFTGHRSDIQNILAVSDIVFSLAKKPEAFGRTTIEALSMGIPVIGYNHGGVAEQLEVMLPEGLINVDDIDAAVDKVIIWQQSPPKIEQSHPFTLKNMCEKTLAIYQTIAEEK
jgi:glycosyltransferase involved in cell wall biosynthesis